ncbi:MAG TPA: PASTA domain-containing protein, partial [Candidatus Marinimicrobia bacterium]|nr:PASTA domain-containing protein [Candidatus Neomarinimicrobiota bacterium]
IGARYADIINPEQTFKTLSHYLGKKPTYYAKIFESKRKYYVLEKNVPLSKGSELIKENLTGVRIEKKLLRQYPYGDIAGHILGYVGWDNEGITGIEHLYNETLRGVEGWEQVQYDRKGRRVSAAGIKGSPKKDGGNVFLTIDIDYQTILEEEIEKAVRTYGAESGMGILINPNTGEILGMASWPNFNPNNAGNEPPGHKRNRVISDSFEPGSVYKIVTAAAALESGNFTRNSMVYCENGKWEFLGRTIHDTKKNEWLSLEDVIIHSSNIGIGKIAQLEGDEAIYNMSKQLGFGEKTGLFPAAEVQGTLRPASEWKRISSTQVAMGHNVTTTLLQLTMAFSAIANNGRLMQPMIVRSAYSPDNELLYSGKVSVIRRVMSESTATIMREILEETVTKGTGVNAYIEGYRVAGKTGTAQKVVDGTYSNSKYISSFIGFFPANKPVLVCGITLDSPTYGKHWGSACATPTVKEVFTRIINTTEFVNLYEWVRPAEKQIADVESRISPVSHPLSASLGTGSTEKSKNTVKNNEIRPMTRSIIHSRGETDLSISVKMPDVRGMTVKNAQHILSRLSMNYEIKGSDKFIIKQNPLPGESLIRGSACVLTTGKRR